MAIGLEVWAPDGTKTLSISDRVNILIDVLAVTGPVTVTNDVLTQGTPYFLYLPASYDGNPHPISVSFSGNTMTITGSSINGYLLFGIF